MAAMKIRKIREELKRSKDYGEKVVVPPTNVVHPIPTNEFTKTPPLNLKVVHSCFEPILKKEAKTL
jgi:hypothetical protein